LKLGKKEITRRRL